jgi:predicted membrane channel-forming protein YqfA (hemolysin III family)
MAGFDTHFTTASVVGIGGVGVGVALFHLPTQFTYLYLGAAIAGGILPDVDERNSIPFRTFKYVAAAVGSLFLIQWGMGKFNWWEATLLGIGGYFLLLWGIGLLQSLTRHRGIFHSIPMGVFISLLLTDASYRLLHLPPSAAYGVGGFFGLGFLTHLLLDELYSLQIGWDRGVTFKTRRSFGTALKWKGSFYPTLLIYLGIGGGVLLLPH